jgi:O-antigen/teichoic acid export membrane protein
MKVDGSGELGVVDRLRQIVQPAIRSRFSRNVVWFTFLSGAERVVAVAQTVLISRALGITEYGVYGLLIGTIGYAGSVAGLQMGLTATVFIARYRDGDKAKASAVITMVGRYAWLSAGAVVVACVPFTGQLSEVLVGSDQYRAAVVLGTVFVGATIISGVQDGIAQGFEIFGAMAKLKVAASVLVLLAMYPVARGFGLTGVLAVILAGLAVKTLLLQRALRRSRADAGITGTGSGVSFRAMTRDFAFPSMVVSLLAGFVTWFGVFLLSRQQSGFDEVAIVSTGLQWRGPVLLLTAALGGVAMPVFSRLSGGGDHEGARRLRRRLSLVNLSVGGAAALVLTVGSGLVLSLYGPDFASGRVAFCIVVLSTIPTVVANVYMQELVGAARMWRQLWMQTPSLVVLSAGFVWLVPKYQAIGYAVTLLLGALALLGPVMAADVWGERRKRTRAAGSVGA